MFGQKNKSAKSAETKEVKETKASSSAGSKKKNKKKDGLSSILNESVAEAALDEFKSNKPFVTTQDGDEVYVGLMLNVADIGGLSKKDKKNESKGAIIECISSGRIKTYLTDELMDDGMIVFIPDAITVDAMNEFQLLADAKYTLCYMNDDFEVRPSDITCTLPEIINIVENDGNVSELLGTANDILDEDDAPYDDEDEDIPDDVEDEPASYDESPFDDDVPDTYEEPEPAFEDEVPADDYDNTYDPNDTFVDEAQPDEQYDNSQYYDEDGNPFPDEVGYDDVQQAITRRFYSDDLDLEVSTEPFDVQFGQRTFVPFNENRGEGWLAEQLNIMSHDANVEMSRLHNDNLFVLRERYLKLVSMHCEMIEKQYDCTKSDTVYGAMFESLKEQRQAAEDKIPEYVAKKTELINENWNQHLIDVGNDAARAAQAQYAERFKRQHEDELFRVEPSVKNDIQAQYDTAKRRMNAERKMQAGKQLDYAINSVLQQISNLYLDSIEQEKQLYDKLASDMRAFVEENRKDEKARIAVLNEQLQQQHEADVVRANATEQVKNLTSEFESKKAALQADIDRMQAEFEQKLRTREDDYKVRLLDSEDRNKALQEQLNNIISGTDRRNAAMKQEYEANIAELKAQAKNWETRCSTIEANSKKNGSVTGILVAVISVATICVGFIIGNYFGVKHNTEQISKELLNSQYQQQINSTQQSSQTSGSTNSSQTTNNNNNTNATSKSDGIINKSDSSSTTQQNSSNNTSGSTNSSTTVKVK